MTLFIAIMQVITLAGLGAVALWIKNYFSSYSTEKGKNLATKQDVEEITDKIEGVKSAYQEQTERLRSALAVAVSRRTAFSDQQRKAFFQFFDHCGELLSDKLIVNPGDLPMDQGQSLVKHQQTVMDMFTAIVLDYNRVVLYCEPGSELPSIAEKVVKSSLEIRKAFRKHFGTLKLRLIEESECYGSGDKDAIHRAVEAANEAARKCHEAIKPPQDAMQTHFSEFCGH